VDLAITCYAFAEASVLYLAMQIAAVAAGAAAAAAAAADLSDLLLYLTVVTVTGLQRLPNWTFETDSRH
jgi:hypothetical protein